MKVQLPEHYSEFDQCHSLIINTGYKFSNDWRIGVKFQYATGLPYTPIIGAKLIDNH